MSFQQLYNMQKEFSDCFEFIFQDAFEKLQKAWMLKLAAIKKTMQSESVEDRDLDSDDERLIKEFDITSGDGSATPSIPQPQS